MLFRSRILEAIYGRERAEINAVLGRQELEREMPDPGPAEVLVEVAAAPDIKWVARIGAATSDTQGPPRPLYLRQPDAQPQDAARLPRR